MTIFAYNDQRYEGFSGYPEFNNNIFVYSPGGSYYLTDISIRDLGTGTATAGDDFTYGIINSTSSVSLWLKLLEDNTREPTETLTLELTYTIRSADDPTYALQNDIIENFTILDATLFTTDADSVNFNSLTASQQAAVAAGVDIYDGRGGSDAVTLPNVANYNVPVGDGHTLGWDPSQTFTTGSKDGERYAVNGGDGNYNIALGAGSDTVIINGDGNSTITGGTGPGQITIAGTGSSTLTAGIGVDTISVTGGGSLKVVGDPQGSATINADSTIELTGPDSGSIVFGTGNSALKIDTATMPSGLISGLTIGDTIELAGLPPLSLTTETYNPSTKTLQFAGDRTAVSLNLSQPVNPDLAFISASSGGSKFTVVPADTADASLSADVVLDATAAFLTSVAAIGTHRGGLTVQEFNKVFEPVFNAFELISTSADVVQIYNDYSSVVSSPTATPTDLKNAFDTATTKIFDLGIQTTVGLLIAAAGASATAAAEAALLDVSATAVGGTLTEFAALLATGALVVEAPVVIGAAATFIATAAFTAYYKENMQADIGQWIQKNVSTPMASMVDWVVDDAVQILHDGYISSATVFADANGNGKLDVGELSTTTDANGIFSLTSNTGPLVAFGGTDISTGLAFKGSLQAPAGSTVIDPLTTLVNGLQTNSGLSLSDAEQKVLAALGLPNIDLTHVDSIAGANSGDTASAAAYVAGAKVIDTVELVAATLASAGISFDKAYSDAFAALETRINSLPGGQTINLSDQGTIAGLINDLAKSEGVQITSAANTAASIAASNAALDQILAKDGATPSLADDVANIQLTAQSVLAWLPVLGPDFAHVFSGFFGKKLAVAAPGVLANDIPSTSGDTLTVSAVNGDPAKVGGTTNGHYGSLKLFADGHYTYDTSFFSKLPPSGVSEDVFTYTVKESGAGGSGSATSTLDIVVVRSGLFYIGAQPGQSTIQAPIGLTAVLDGSPGHLTLKAGIGLGDVLVGGNGDVLNGAIGRDTFVLMGNYGQNTINNYKGAAIGNYDVIQFSKADFATVADVRTHASQTAKGTLIADEEGNSVLLAGIELKSLHFDANHFVLV